MDFCSSSTIKSIKIVNYFQLFSNGILINHDSMSFSRFSNWKIWLVEPSRRATATEPSHIPKRIIWGIYLKYVGENYRGMWELLDCLGSAQYHRSSQPYLSESIEALWVFQIYSDRSLNRRFVGMGVTVNGIQPEIPFSDGKYFLWNIIRHLQH